MARRDCGTWGCLAGAGAGGFWSRWLLGLCEAGLGWFDVLRVDGFKREALDALIGLRKGVFWEEEPAPGLPLDPGGVLGSSAGFCTLSPDPTDCAGPPVDAVEMRERLRSC